MDAIILWTKLISSLTVATLPLLRAALYRIIHSRTYRVGPSPANVVIIGASFAGHQAARALSHSLPSGWRVVLIEKNSHFHFSWVFPRFAVVPEHEQEAFIPYTKAFADAPQGAVQLVQGEVVAVSDKEVRLKNGETIPFEYLVIGTGAVTGPPARMNQEEKRDGMAVLKGFQEEIRKATNVVVVGGGAAGVELVADAKALYAEKNVTLVHSRGTLLNAFGPKLHEAAMKGLGELGVEVVLGERVMTEVEDGTLKLQSGKELPCDCLIKCTGQGYASAIVSSLSPASVSPTSGGVLVKPSLQLRDDAFTHVFAVGDVVDFGVRGLNSRSAFMQAELAARNIVALASRRENVDVKLAEYTPAWWENGIELTLGLNRSVLYFADEKREFLMWTKSGDIAAKCAKCWRMFGLKPYEDPEFNLPKESHVQ